ncbi:unnamed protein product [Chironomus riparius]|uniref:Uncharacterized protein n=1 Tax=Chironomus riparius TaxID=315576 RepID=A0A9N9RNE2_9DIPT|nr:unnamed protein product [Chironomus riparius]
MRIYSHRTIKSLMDRPRFAQHKFEGGHEISIFLSYALQKVILVCDLCQNYVNSYKTS